MAEAFDRVRKQLPGVTEWRCLADGNQIPPVPVPCSAVVKGDRLIPEIMAASILAKTERDRYMLEADKLYPEYGFRRHKGYPTKEHREICLRIGPSPIHRRSFRLR